MIPIHTKKVKNKWYCFSTFDGYDYSFKGSSKEFVQNQMKEQLKKNNLEGHSNFMEEEIYDTPKQTGPTNLHGGYWPLIALMLICISCSTKRYLQEGVNLKPQEDKYHVQAKLVKVQRNMQGFKHWFVSDKNDTLIRTYQKPLQLDSCYYVWKTKLDK